jgi:putative transposase
MSVLPERTQLYYVRVSGEHVTKYGGLDVSEARRLRSLEDENRRLKKLLAETMLDVAMLKDIASKKW